MLIRIVGLAGGVEFARPLYVIDFDPNEGRGAGRITLVSDPADALRFPSFEEALAFYRQQAVEPYDLRRDGLPNRPLTAYTVEFVHAEEAVPA